MYTTGQGEKIFGWEDAGADEPAILAAKFVERFLDIIVLGRGNDPEYVSWYSAMVKDTEPAGLIYAYSDWDDSSFEYLNVLGESIKRTVPFPPPGQAGYENPT